MKFKTLVSYNVNGIRAAMKKGFVEWLKENDYDVVCIQESKAREEQVDTKALEDIGYHHYWHSAKKAGYSGVAVFSKIKPDNVVIGCGISKYDDEGRIIRVDFGDVSILNCYFPSGTSGDKRQIFKMEFLRDIHRWIKVFKSVRPNLIVVGDYNIAHSEMDIHNPARNHKTSGFLPEEREWLTDWFDSGFVDAYRYLNPDDVTYSWWSYRAKARANNKGWRIDYQSVSKNLVTKIKNSKQLTDIVHSDHCPVLVEFEE